MQPRGVCRIDLDALAHNLREVRRVVGSAVRVCGVVKADAYGHGAVPVARTLLAHGADSLAVACFDEARDLRRGGIAAPVLVLGGVPASDATAACELGLSVVAWDARSLAELAAALPAGRRLRVHLKFDTGMNRIGAPVADVGALADAVRGLAIDVEGVMSHLACGEVVSDESVARQRARFEEALAALAQQGLRPGLRHLANSGGLLSDPATHYDMVRPGIVLYGALPARELASRVSVRPVMQLAATVIQVRDVAAGERVGYGLTFEAKRPSRIAVLALGYAQGVPRSLSNRGAVVVRDRLAPIAGIVSMDHTAIDVTDVPEVATGDEAIFWGRAEEPRLDVMDVGERAGTLGYELLTRVAASVPRVYRARDVARRASGRA
ncbi:MAG TPA: alanine racemase [Candidatus Binatia bacterium]|nr:alanine racemase [Candidatus Binatia bacterium]